MKLYPKCHPYWQGEERTQRNVKPMAYISRGYLVPCSWCDTADLSDMEERGFLADELKVENNISIKNILISKTWVDFHRSLIDDPDNAPKCCKEACSEKYDRK